MSQLSLLRCLLIGAVLGGVFLFSLVEQISDPANRHQTSSKRLTRAQVAGAMEIISEICYRTELGVILQRSQLTEGQFDNANTLVSEVCNQAGDQAEQAPLQPARHGSSILHEI